jgi:hypothetical protein
MGRLRSCEDSHLIAKITAEVTELFGTDDAALYRYIAVWTENINRKDPVWGEPTSTPAYKRFDLPVHWFDWASIENASELGLEQEIEISTAYIALNHLLAAGVPIDQDGDYVAPGDILSLHNKCGHVTTSYDILTVDRDGWINSTDQFTQYKLSLKRRQKYEPERKLV